MTASTSVPRPGLTSITTVRREAGDATSFRRLETGPGEEHLLRRTTSPGERADVQDDGSCLLRLLQVSDFQLADFSSPTRLEFLQRLGGSPTWQRMVPSYRPQEFTVVAQVEAMARTVRELAEDGLALDLVLTTGDNTDNQQHNELDQFVALMSGGEETRGFPDGARPGTGVDGPVDPAYFHPDPDVDDVWKQHAGFPGYIGVLDDAVRTFLTTGFGVPWVACFGNHDALVQGRSVATPEVAGLLAGDRKPVLLDEDTRVATETGPAEAMDVYLEDPVRYSDGPSGQVEADPARRLFDRATYVAAMRKWSAMPDSADGGSGHADEADDVAYFAHHPRPGVRLLVLDTTNPGGDVDGSVGARQLAWLEEQLAEADRADELVLVASHHGLSTMGNTRVALDASGEPVPGQDLPRAAGPEIAEVLARCPGVALWLSGHTHRNRVHSVGDGEQAFWEVSTSAMIDWPCQARLLEVHADGDDLLLRCTMVDHRAQAAPDTETDPLLRVAAVGRELAANIYDGVGGACAEGEHADRNVTLVAPVPARVRRALEERSGTVRTGP